MKKRKWLPRGLFSSLAFSELPVAPQGGYRIEVDGRGEGIRILVSGARRILSCTEGEVVLLSGKSRLHFEGEGLTCLTYDGGVAEITGRIFGFSVRREGEKC